MGVGLVGAAGAIVTGLRDYSYIPRDRPDHGIATTHGLGNAVVASLFTASFALRRPRQRPSLFTRLLALAGGGLSWYTAWLGGVLVEEYGEAVKPVMEQQQKEDQKRQQAVPGARQQEQAVGSGR